MHTILHKERGRRPEDKAPLAATARRAAAFTSSERLSQRKYINTSAVRNAKKEDRHAPGLIDEVGNINHLLRRDGCWDIASTIKGIVRESSIDHLHINMALMLRVLQPAMHSIFTFKTTFLP